MLSHGRPLYDAIFAFSNAIMAALLNAVLATAYLLGQPGVAVNFKVVALIINNLCPLRCISVVPNKPVLEGHCICLLVIFVICAVGSLIWRSAGRLHRAEGLSRNGWGLLRGCQACIGLALLTV